MIRCVAIDDEPIALEIIKQHCKRFGEIELFCFTSPVEGISFIKSTLPELVFMDIEMNSHSGLELAAQLPSGTVLVFTTAFAHYALEGFNVNAIDFLHKPIFYPRFLQAMEKAKTWIRINRSNKMDQEPVPASHDTIILKSSHKNVVIALDSVLYIEAMDNYVKIYRKSLPPIVTQITMKEMESLLPGDKFLRVHRSFIVSKEAIDRYSNRKIYLHETDKSIPVGRTYQETLLSVRNK